MGMISMLPRMGTAKQGSYPLWFECTSLPDPQTEPIATQIFAFERSSCWLIFSGSAEATVHVYHVAERDS